MEKKAELEKEWVPRTWDYYSRLYVPGLDPHPAAFNHGSWNDYRPINHRKSKGTFGNDIHRPSTDPLSRRNPSSDRGHFMSSILVPGALLLFAMIPLFYLILSNAGHCDVPGLSESGTESQPIIPKPTIPSRDDSTFPCHCPVCGFQDIGTVGCISALFRQSLLLLTYTIIAGAVGLVLYLVYSAGLRHQTKKKDSPRDWCRCFPRCQPYSGFPSPCQRASRKGQSY